MTDLAPLHYPVRNAIRAAIPTASPEQLELATRNVCNIIPACVDAPQTSCGCQRLTTEDIRAFIDKQYPDHYRRTEETP